MKEVGYPTVRCIAEPFVNTDEMLTYLREVGGEVWYERIGAQVALKELPQAEGLIEFMGRLCYRSWEPGLNANVTKIREDHDDYLRNILQSAHGSVLEHAYFSFAIHNCSRVLTAELNRHRAGVAISEQSLRFVRLDQDIPFRLPHNVLKATSCEMMAQGVEYLEHLISRIYLNEGIDTDKDFHEKKTITSAVRRVAPLGIATEEGWTANVRTIRHILEQRTNPGAEEEIRVFANRLGEKMVAKCPALFGDYTVTDGHWETPFKKVWSHRKD